MLGMPLILTFSPREKENFSAKSFSKQKLETRNQKLNIRLLETILFPLLQNRLAHCIRRLSNFAAKVLLFCQIEHQL